MTDNDMNQIFEKMNLPKKIGEIESNDWDYFKEKFNITDIDLNFVIFMDLINHFEFPGDIYFLIKSEINDNIFNVYDHEIKYGDWNASLIPFYGIGNGDYFCISGKDFPVARVYFFDHSDNSVIVKYFSFEDFVNDIHVYITIGAHLAVERC